VNVGIWLVFECRYGLAHDVCQEIDQAGARLHLGTVRGEGEAVLRDFEQRDAEGPDIGSDGVRLAGDSFRGHVVGCADKGVGVSFGAEFAADAKVAELDLAVAAEENVGRFDV
jgi:hypothetical protein